MDINEFNVACKLITMKLKGFEIPPVLPPSLKMILSGTGTTTPVLSPQAQVQPIVPPQAHIPVMPTVPMQQPLPTAVYGVVSPPMVTSPPLAVPPQTLSLGGQLYQQGIYKIQPIALVMV